MRFMKRIVTLLTLTMSLWSLCAIGVYAAETEKPTASADISVLSKHIWRGYELSDDSIVVQPSVTVGYKGFSMNLWANLDTAYDDMDPLTDDDADWTETDFTFSYDKSFGLFSVGGGFIYYALTGADTKELYLRVGFDVPLSPSITVYKDIAEYNGYYVNMGVSHSFALPRDMSLDLSGGIGYYYSTDDEFVEFNDQLAATTNKYRSIHDGVLSASLVIPLDKYFTSW